MATTTDSRLPRPGPVGQPDIAYTPNHTTYLARAKRRQETEDLEKSLPSGFPSHLDSDLVWDGNTVSETYEGLYSLSDSELKEVNEALKYFQNLKKPLGFVDQDTFPLPNLHATLRGISKELHFGHGFKVIRGIPTRRYSHEENFIVYAGLASHIAPVRGRQDNSFEGATADVVLGHIKNLSGQVFHTDYGDIVGLLALSASAEGGESYLSSSWKVYNELATTRPDLIKTLSEPWAFEEFGKNSVSYSLRPLLYHQPATDTAPERLIMQYTRRSFTGYWGQPRSGDIPPITEAQAEALDALHFTAEKYRLSLNFQEGDIQFINNLNIFHARGAFRDSPEQQRHLVRLWLRDPEYAWETPDLLKERWSRVYGGVTPEKSVFPLKPGIRSTNYGGTLKTGN